MIPTILAGIVVLITHGLEAITGFGCTVLALPFMVQIFGLKTGVMVLAVLAWILALYFVITKFKHINFRRFLVIVGCAGAGLPIGMYFFTMLPADVMKRALGVFIIVVAIMYLVTLFFSIPLHERIPSPVFYVLLFLGGIVHGAFASGGPFIVLYASRYLKDKSEFRSTLCLLWTTLNTALIISYLTGRKISSEHVGTIGMLIPFLVAGIILGELVHNRLNDVLFRKIVFSALLAVGVVMVV